MSEIIGASVEEMNNEPVAEQPPVNEKMLNVGLTFTEEGVKIDVRSNLAALEQLGAIEIFKAHLLASALGNSKE